MSAERSVTRALARLSAPNARLAPARTGRGFAIYPHDDRRRRPVARLTVDDVQRLESEGAIARAEAADCFVLTAAGRARLRRDAAQPNEGYLEQHRPVVERSVMGADGATRHVRGHDPNSTLRRLEALRGPDGAPWLDATELAAATRLRNDWEQSQIDLVRGSDLSAAPLGATARGPSNARERLLAARCDAQRRMSDALDQLAPCLRRVVEAACLQEEGMETLERAQRWPVRSGKVALKLGLAQLAAAFVQAGRRARAAD